MTRKMRKILQNGVTRALEECYKSVTRVLQGCYESITLPEDRRVDADVGAVLRSTCVTRVLQECHKSIIRVLHIQ
jgi:hypothetical protein